MKRASVTGSGLFPFWIARDRFDMHRHISLEAKAPQPICEVHQRLHARIIVPAKLRVQARGGP